MSVFKQVSVKAFLLSLLLYPVNSSPLESRLTPREPRVDVIKTSTFDVLKRQDNIDDDLDTEAEEGTKPLRQAVDARKLYTKQATATWYQVDTAANDLAAIFTPFTETTTDVKPKDPSDRNQYAGPHKWNVDHILELQVIARAFDKAHNQRPSNIPQADWDKATSAVFTKGPENTAIAKAVTNLKNLQGIPNSLNSFKKQVFTGNLTGKGYPGTGDGATYFSFFGPAVQKYLKDNQDGLMRGTNDDIGDKLKSIGNNNQQVKDYYTSYASFHYQGCINYLSTWSGKELDRTSTSASANTTATSFATTTKTSSATTRATSSADAAQVTCYHAASPGPGQSCEAIRNSEGWCDCGDSNKYVMKDGDDICGWTTKPATTSFDCTPTETPDPPEETPDAPEETPDPPEETCENNGPYLRIEDCYDDCKGGRCRSRPAVWSVHPVYSVDCECP